MIELGLAELRLAEPGSSHIRKSHRRCLVGAHSKAVQLPPSLAEKNPAASNSARLDSLLQLRADEDDGSEHCCHICVDVEFGLERACKHVSSLSSTVLMLGRSSGSCAQHSHVTAGIPSLCECEGFESCGRSPFKALEAAAAPVNSLKARRSCVSSQSKNANA